MFYIINGYMAIVFPLYRNYCCLSCALRIVRAQCRNARRPVAQCGKAQRCVKQSTTYVSRANDSVCKQTTCFPKRQLYKTNDMFAKQTASVVVLTHCCSAKNA